MSQVDSATTAYVADDLFKDRARIFGEFLDDPVRYYFFGFSLVLYHYHLCARVPRLTRWISTAS